MHADAFEGTNDLIELEIRSFRLSFLPPLHQISHSLQYLSILFSNHIRSPSTGYLTHCRVLKSLRIGHTSLPNLRLGLNEVSDTVQILDFENNMLTSFSEIHCINFPTLVKLILTTNFIRSIKARELLFPSLKYLDLNHNNIKYLGDPSPIGWGSALPDGSFINIYIYSNPWNCSKSFDWLPQGLFRKTSVFVAYRKVPFKVIIYKINHMICRIPHEKNGLSVVSQDVMKDVLLGEDLSGNATGRDVRQARLSWVYCKWYQSWWRHQMGAFSALLTLCAGKCTSHRWIPRTKASDAELWCLLWYAHEKGWVNYCGAGDRDAIAPIMTPLYQHLIFQTSMMMFKQLLTL